MKQDAKVLDHKVSAALVAVNSLGLNGVIPPLYTCLPTSGVALSSEYFLTKTDVLASPFSGVLYWLLLRVLLYPCTKQAWVGLMEAFCLGHAHARSSRPSSFRPEAVVWLHGLFVPTFVRVACCQLLEEPRTIFLLSRTIARASL